MYNVSEKPELYKGQVVLLTGLTQWLRWPTLIKTAARIVLILSLSKLHKATFEWLYGKLNAWLPLNAKPVRPVIAVYDRAIRDVESDLGVMI